MSKDKQEITTVADASLLAQLAEAYPQEEGSKNILLPRIGLVSQDKTEESGSGKNKKITVISAAGDFYINRKTDELNEEGKNIWIKEDIGTEFKGIVFFKRHQLRMYDENTEEYTTSPVFDSLEEEVPLFCNKKEVAKGKPAELKSRYMYTDKSGKERSALEDNRILYILYKGEAYQIELRGSSMFSLLTYERSVAIPTVVTQFSSEAMEKGDISWNKMTFKAVRKLTDAEAKEISGHQIDTMQMIKQSKGAFSKQKSELELANDKVVKNW